MKHTHHAYGCGAPGYGAPFSQIPRFAFHRSRWTNAYAGIPALGGSVVAAVPIAVTRSMMPSSLAGHLPQKRGAVPRGFGAYGRADGPSLRGPYQDVAPTDTTSSGSWLSQYAPAINALVTTVFDPRREAARLRARLADARARGASPTTIHKLEEQLAAVEQMAAERQSTVAEGQAWQQGITRNLWVVTGLGVAGIVLVGAAAYRTGRNAGPRSNPRRRR